MYDIISGSMPVITCVGENKVEEVVAEITTRGYCLTNKNILFQC